MADHMAVASPIDAVSMDMAQSSLEHRVVQYTDGSHLTCHFGVGFVSQARETEPELEPGTRGSG